jgi:hypothetical protein
MKWNIMNWNITIRESRRRSSQTPQTGRNENGQHGENEQNGRRENRGHKDQHAQKGYTLLFAVFLVAATIIASSAIALKLKTQAQREKEIEMIWRGEQYKRGIRRYVQKFGRYPTRIDDLVKPTNGVRFMRAAYKDPMSKDDGSWRFIYVTQTGALIGSVRYVSLTQMAMMEQMAMRGGTGLGVPGLSGVGGGLAGNALGQPGSGIGGQGGFGGQGGIGGQGGFGSTNAPGAAPTCVPAPPSANGSDNGTGTQNNGGVPPTGGTANNCPPGQIPGPPGANSNGFGFGPFGGGTSTIGQPQTLGTPLETTAIGGNIIGVGSKVDKPSLKIYKRGKTYREWEFIFNPLEQNQVGGGSSGPAGVAPVGGTFPSSGQGTTSPFGGNGNGNGNGGFGTPPTSELQQPPNQQPPNQQQQQPPNQPQQ